MVPVGRSYEKKPTVSGASPGRTSFTGTSPAPSGRGVVKRTADKLTTSTSTPSQSPMRTRVPGATGEAVPNLTVTEVPPSTGP